MAEDCRTFQFHCYQLYLKLELLYKTLAIQEAVKQILSRQRQAYIDVDELM